MNKELWLAVLSSSLIAGVIGALIGGWFNLLAKRSEYTNEYFKIVLKRRVEAYEKVEHLMILLKSAVMDKDQVPHHLLFEQKEEDIFNLIFGITASALWLSDELFDKTRTLNVLYYKHGPSHATAVEFGKKYYATIAELRTEMERIHARDMLSLHEVRRFLKSKRPTDSYERVLRDG